MENYSVQVPPYTVGPKRIDRLKNSAIFMERRQLLLVVKKRWQPQRINCLPR